MNKHTPGPWKILDGTLIYGPDKGQVADTSGSEGAFFDTRQWRSQQERWANGHLISAAPDLLEACKLAVKSWFSGEVSEIQMEVVLKAAIAKAEGRS